MLPMGLVKLFAAAAVLVVIVLTLIILRRLRRPPRYTYATALSRHHPTHPGELGLTFAERRVELAPGLYTTAWIIDGQGPPDVAIVVVHAYGESRYCLLRWLNLLTPAAGKVVLYDLRAHGDSSSDRSGMALEEAHDLGRLLEVLDLPPRVVLLGRSLGSGLALATAAQRPGDVAGVIIEGSYRFGRQPLRGYLRSRGVPAWPFTALVDLYYAVRTGPPSRYDRAKWAAQLQCPLLVLHGNDDEVCGTAPAQEVAQAAKVGTFVGIEQAGHLDAPLKQPQAYADAVARFVAALPAPSRTSLS